MFSFVIPVFNNQETITKTFLEIKKFCKESFEVIFVNDGSIDSSLHVLNLLAKKNKNIRLVNLKKNYGQLSAIKAGVSIVKGNLVFIISADLQDDFSVIPQMISCCQKGHKIIVARRVKRDDSFITKFYTFFAYKIIKIFFNIPSGGFDYFLIDTLIIKDIFKISDNHMYLQGEIVNYGEPIKYIDYRRKKRLYGKSGWSLHKKIKFFIDILISGHIIKPWYFTIFGLLLGVSSIFYIILIIIDYFLYGIDVAGWAPIMIVVLLSSSILIVMLGLILEYVWRVYENQKFNEPYIIDKDSSKF